ncbi:xanthine dehydrogenase family protein subunit M [Blastococcus sp. CT_GayMR19]|uniref:FAD binding domain-containing protein n=1 Tax=Blastococcus sp. CT_GayMR19 TaxID=2559608 RepID=UPI0010733D9D|nr:xanthine dehydrogenase family protein subunit M [Blastococcus sp. CT_GayMR19]TFV77404.1 xanthine dehydrogenase family protein subunit M [Blastococcus sp. CT_GayMR19]
MRLFDYHRPTTVGETSALMAELGDEAALLAGGTSLMNLAKLGLAEPAHVIALRDVDELHGLDGDPVQGLRLGAMTTLRAVETSESVRALAPGLAEAAHHVATVRIRNQATVGGNLVHADPNQDLPPMLMVYDAVARITGPDGVRTVPVADMFVGFFESVLEPDEILDSVSVPPCAPGLRSGYLKFLPRTQDDYSTIAVAAGLQVRDGRITHARIAVAGGGSTAVRCRAAETALVGNGTDDATLTAAADIVPGLLDPVADGRGSSGYKRDMARVCTQRLLQRLVAEGAA